MKKRLITIGIALLLIVLGVLGWIYAESHALFYDKFKIVFDIQTEEEKLEVQEYFDNVPMTSTRVNKESNSIQIINDKYTNLDNIDISTFSLKVKILDESKMEFIGESDMLYIPAEYGKTYHVTITGDIENGLVLHLDE